MDCCRCAVCGAVYSQEFDTDRGTVRRFRDTGGGGLAYLVAPGARRAMSVQSLRRIAILGAVVIETAGIVLRARGGVGALVQVGLHDGDAGRRHHGNAVVGHVVESGGLTTG